MGFSSKVKGSFAGGVRLKGTRYLEQGRVEILEGTSSRVAALVRGSSDYLTVLELNDSRLRVACTCPYFEGHEPCKHIWAAGLAAEKDGLLTAECKESDLKVLPDPALLKTLETGTVELDAEDPLEEFLGDFDDFVDPLLRKKISEKVAGLRRRKPKSAPVWKKSFEWIRSASTAEDRLPAPVQRLKGEIVYTIDVAAAFDQGELLLESRLRKIRSTGESLLKPFAIDPRKVSTLPDAEDRRLLTILLGSEESANSSNSPYYYGYSRATSKFHLGEHVLPFLLPALSGSGRLLLRMPSGRAGAEEHLGPVTWDEGEPWELRLRVQDDQETKHWLLDGFLQRKNEMIPLSEPVMLLPAGFVFFKDRVARLTHHDGFAWIRWLRKEPVIRIPKKAEEKMLEELWSVPHLPPVDWPEPLRFETIQLPPRPHLTLRPGNDRYRRQKPLRAELRFLYGSDLVRAKTPSNQLADVRRRRVLLRDPTAENVAKETLSGFGFKAPPSYILDDYQVKADHDLELPPRRMAKVVRRLLEAGWHVEAEGKLYRQAGELKINVTTGVDWFDVNGQVDFGGKVVALPALLAALRRGENTVVLDDGTLGMLPEAWLKKFGLILGSGSVEDESIRFRKTQIGLLDALLAAEPSANVDKAFAKARGELQAFDGVHAVNPEGEFHGTLRAYQCEGLGWLEFLRRFGFGGCLADDMGLGKTVQVLALLESRRAERSEKRQSPEPSLVVVPRSLVFNWKSEAAKFTPSLRVLDHSGIDRVKAVNHFQDYDLVITTYGTLRRDAPFLKDTTFDCVILDEAQAVKNSETESAKAVRLLKGCHRLALSGTPIENHLGELWSLFEFLNPGMLGAASAFKLFTGNLRTVHREVLPILQRALRPFILRRTKAQVAKDLPEKTEHTILCDLESEQKKLYDELRDHFRAKLLGLIEKDGLGKSQFQVLEALLRLRQAACHPGLVDKARRGESSAKLDLLLGRVKEVLEGGHKVLVFSQFTQFLGILRSRLGREGIQYEYLDGQTRDRQRRVERFQTDSSLKLFLISLKAGGLGLNLTAAEYVFLLDPWWNPAVEAQAIDRAHRIGQTRNVFAYRLVARETVEEKVLELQRTKRELADAIINAENGGLRGLTKDDLERLLS